MVKNDEKKTLGEKLKSARKSAGLTQEQLAEKLLVSRQAITKWEADKGMPDIENLKQLSKLLDISIDYLLDSGENIDLSVMREEINLDDYTYTRKFKGRWSKKSGKKDMVVLQKYPNAEIHGLLGKQILTKGEKIIDNAIGFLTNAPFGIPELLNGIKNTDKEFYLVNQSDKQFFVIVTDEFMESRQLAEKIADKKFSIGNFSFVDCGIISTQYL
ncbi:MAG: helix-turn-helix transcriptional regulator [Lachnospiraceae bacterium]|nr:helix-turn-helix transcriptional regulator [Lachnospiraceae bacterium]